MGYTPRPSMPFASPLRERRWILILVAWGIDIRIGEYAVRKRASQAVGLALGSIPTADVKRGAMPRPAIVVDNYVHDLKNWIVRKQALYRLFPNTLITTVFYYCGRPVKTLEDMDRIDFERITAGSYVE